MSSASEHTTGGSASGAGGDEGHSPQRAEGELPPIPLSVKLVAFFFILVGVLSAVEIGIALVDGRVSLQLGVVGIFIGRGLLRRSERCRGCAIGCLGFALCCAAFMALSIPVVLLVFRGDENVRFTFTLPPVVAFALLIAGFAIALWSYRALTRPDVCTSFSASAQQAARPGTGDSDRRRGRFQYSLASLLAAVVVCAFVFGRISSEDVRYKRQTVTMRRVSADGTSWNIQYAYLSDRFLNRPDVLGYVVFSDDEPYKRNPVGADSQGARIITRPDGTTLKLVGSGLLVEQIDGDYRQTSHRVERQQFEDFLASEPERYTIDALLRFIRTRPK